MMMAVVTAMRTEPWATSQGSRVIVFGGIPKSGEHRPPVKFTTNGRSRRLLRKHGREALELRTFKTTGHRPLRQQLKINLSAAAVNL
jgi:hypothetical protein